MPTRPGPLICEPETFATGTSRASRGASDEGQSHEDTRCDAGIRSLARHLFPRRSLWMRVPSRPNGPEHGRRGHVPELLLARPHRDAKRVPHTMPKVTHVRAAAVGLGE